MSKAFADAYDALGEPSEAVQLALAIRIIKAVNEVPGARGAARRNEGRRVRSVTRVLPRVGVFKGGFCEGGVDVRCSVIW